MQKGFKGTWENMKSMGINQAQRMHEKFKGKYVVSLNEMFFIFSAKIPSQKMNLREYFDAIPSVRLNQLQQQKPGPCPQVA